MPGWFWPPAPIAVWRYLQTRLRLRRRSRPQWSGGKKLKIPAVALAGIEGGQVAWAQAWGDASPGRPADVDTVFNVASLTKPVFALTALHAMAEGDMALDTPLADYFTDPDVAGDDRHLLITPRLALSHQTGLPNWRGSRKLAFQFTPGARYDYSGEGYEYARRALEVATGKGFRTLFDTYIGAPLALENTSLGWRDELEGQVATGFNEAGEPYDMAYLKERGPNAAAHLFTSVSDYAAFAAWVSRGAGLPAPLFAEMTRPQAQHANPAEFFGLGWRLVQVDGETVLTHDGRENGVRTLVVVMPDKRRGFVLVTNSSNGELIMRPLVEAALPRGTALMKATDRDTWLYLASVPDQVKPRMLQFIASSPSFVSKLLYAVDTVLVDTAGLDAEDRKAANALIDDVVIAAFEGRADSASILALFQGLGQQTDSGFQIHGTFAKSQALAWIEALKQLSQAS